VGRALADEISGSLALVAKARTVFVLQPGHDGSHEDDTVIFDCAKCNNGQPLEASAWRRKPHRFEALPDFDFDTWLNPPPEEDRKAVVTLATMETLFNHGRRWARKKDLIEELKSQGVSQTTAYRVLNPEDTRNQFRNRLIENDGMIGWGKDEQ
jgi:hypothetical protein